MRIKNKIKPCSLQDLVCKTFKSVLNLHERSNIHSRNTRKRDSLNTPLFRTTAGQRTFQYRAANIWNNLDSQMKNYSLKKFKVEMKDKLLSSLLW